MMIGGFSLILANIFDKKLRLVLTLFSITVAFFLYIALGAFQNSLEAGTDLAGADRMVVVNKINFTQPMPYAYFNRIRAIEGVIDASHANWFGGYYQQPQNFVPMFSVSPEPMLRMFDKEIILDAQEREAFLGNRQALIAGRKTAEKYGWQTGDRIPVNSNIFTNQSTGGSSWDFVVAGIYDTEDPLMDQVSVYFHYPYFNESRNVGRDTLGFITIQTASPDLNDSVAQQIDTMFANSPFETETAPEAAFSAAFLAQIGNIGLIIGSVIGGAFFTILFIVGNTMAITVRERTRQIGVLKALGFSSLRIFAMVLGESLTIAIIGGLLGLGIALLALPSINAGLANFAQIQLTVSPDILVRASALMVGLGIATGLLPAIGALRLNVITALSRRQA